MRKLMRTLRKAFRYGEAGFTLIELLVVIGILAALAGVVTLAVGQFIGQGEGEANLTDQHNVQTAVIAHMAQFSGDVPVDEAELVSDGLLLSLPKCDYTWDGTTGKILTQTCP